jgi:hypothetical protein
MNHSPINEQDVRSLADKLAAFSQTLSSGELAAFEMIEQHVVTSTEAVDPDVLGYYMSQNDITLADMHRQEMLAEAAQRRPSRSNAQASGATAPERSRSGLWQSLMLALTSHGRVEGAPSEATPTA